MWPQICRYFKLDNRSAVSSSLFWWARNIHISRIHDRLRKSDHLWVGISWIIWCSTRFEKCNSQRWNGYSLLKWIPWRRNWVFRIPLSSLQPVFENRSLHPQNDVLNRILTRLDSINKLFSRSLSFCYRKGRDSNICLRELHHNPLYNLPSNYPNTK